MSSQCTCLFLSSPPSLPTTSSILSSHQHLPGVWLLGTRDERDFRPKCIGVSKPRIQETLQNDLPLVLEKLQEIAEDDLEGEDVPNNDLATSKIKQHVESVKSMLGSMEDGEILSSAYDTAWVALVENIDGSGLPQFPSCLEWIANNQLPDGSWGDREIFNAHDRILSTIACVVALKSWNLHPEQCQKGMAYFKETISKLGEENPEHMSIGFEVVFPSMLEIARSLKLEVPDQDSPLLHEIYAMRNTKLTKIPKEIMHKVPTSLLFSLEGMEGLEWEKLQKLQSKDGSFLSSLASTAYAFMKTRDPNCFTYLAKVVHKFQGGVPMAYPMDLFEHTWVVDRLQRLGISRYFESQLKECMNYVYRYWTEKGIFSARSSNVEDIDDTSMSFRLLRLHRHHVSADVFEHFKKGNEFICMAGQTTQAVTGMYSLYRASQVMFPGETILEEAKDFSTKYLREKQASNELLDKWIITKDLPGEVGYGLEVPWYASLPRLETRFYIEQYGGAKDVWIGKILYRMPYVSNNTYLEVAKLDYNNCQALHLIEWDNIQKWYEENKLEDCGLSRRSLLVAYFVAASSVFETERANERLAWAKTMSLIETIGSHFKGKTRQQRRAFVHQFRTRKMKVANKKAQRLMATLLAALNHLSLDAMVAHGQDISQPLRQAWEKWLVEWHEKGDMHQNEAELIIQTNIRTAGLSIPEELLSKPDHQQLLEITNRVCNKLRSYQNQKHKENGNGSYNVVSTREIELDMQQLVQMVLKNCSDDIESSIKQTCFEVARSFYYSAYLNPATIDDHITKVLFDRVRTTSHP